jgi:AcrR family transcriptional regulator
LSTNPSNSQRSHAFGPAQDTKGRLLEAAERLFAERGFDGTSIRAVAQAADASVSAANYHFGSKEALLHTALVRRIEPINRQRLDALSALERSTGDEPVPLESIVEAFLRPGFEAEQRERSGDAPYRHIAAQLYADPHDTLIELKAELFGPVITRFTDALALTLHDRSREELVLDFQFLVGVMIHVISGHARNEEAGAGPLAIPAEQVLRRMVTFTSAGLRSKTAPEPNGALQGDSR